MTDNWSKRLKEAVRMLRENDVSCVVLCEGKEAYLSEDIGIKPLMTLLRRDRCYFENGVIADRVVGKAAALMAVLGGAGAVYGVVMSETAMKVFEKYGMYYEYLEKVPYISNRAHTGRCPLEEAVAQITDPEAAYCALEETIAGLMRKKDNSF